jgi:hypothetical protein
MPLLKFALLESFVVSVGRVSHGFICFRAVLVPSFGYYSYQLKAQRIWPVRQLWSVAARSPFMNGEWWCVAMVFEVFEHIPKWSVAAARRRKEHNSSIPR